MNALDSLAESVVDVLGIRFHRVTQQQVIERLLHWIAEKSHRMVITAGPEYVMRARHDQALKELTRSADFVTADGVGVVWASGRLGRPVPERVSGVELVTALLDEAERRREKLRVYVLGASDAALIGCLSSFRQTYPTASFEGHNGYFSTTAWPAILNDIVSFVPDLWLVGLGQPRQEHLIYETLGKIPPCVAIGVGGSIDVWGGTIARAPMWTRKLNVEWLYRLVRQPSRWRRQLALPRFAVAVLRQDGH